MSTQQAISTSKNRGESKLLILAIETSCDETAVAVVCRQRSSLKILSNQVSSQVKLHAKWGGVVPNLAAREHVKNLDLMLESALQEARILPADIDVISTTQGPGLIPALLVGVSYAKTLSYLWGKPLLGIHHIEGHIYANFVGISNFQFSISKQIQKTQISEEIKKDTLSIIENCKLKIENSKAIFPALALVVSGGHTQLVLMKDHLQYEIIGQTVDDAVGEAFDKVARILGIGYPGGPAVAAWAAKHKTWNMEHAAKFQNPNVKFPIKSQAQISNDKKNISYEEAKKLTPKKFTLLRMRSGLIFPRPMLNKQGFNFSFSGLKTAVLYETKKHPKLLKDKKYLAEVCHEFQQACVDVLVAKTIRATEKYQPKTILLAGGVSANSELRQQLGEAINQNLSHTSYYVPELSLTGDNAAMIGAAGAFRWQKMTDKQKKSASDSWKKLQPDANLKMK